MSDFARFARQFKTPPGQSVAFFIFGAIAGVAFILWGVAANSWVQIAAGAVMAVVGAPLAYIGTRALWQTARAESLVDEA